MILRIPLLLALVASLASLANACDLCAISSADSARGESTSGFLFTVSEQFIPWRTEYLDGKEYNRKGFSEADFVDKSITHLVPAWNISDRVGISLNVPLVYERYRRHDVIFSGSGVQAVTEQGDESGLGDLSLVGRVALYRKSKMKWSFSVNALAGVKFPTGDTELLKTEIDRVRGYNEFVGPGHPHDALGVQLSGVHLSHLSLGSGSFDGIFGMQVNARWDRWYFNALAQYYLRTEGESTYQFGDEIMINGGPGAYILLQKRCTLGVQAYAGYESQARDTLFGLKSNSTGMTAWYLGPQVTFTWGLHLAAQAAVDLPLWITNNGFQNVPDYRIHGSLTWAF